MSFFGKNRKNLPDGQGFKQYLLYALGEILLVVIGILIALKINNWSEIQKEDEKGRIYLQSILEDLGRERMNVEKMVIR